MADHNIQNILAALAAQQSQSSTPTQSTPVPQLPASASHFPPPHYPMSSAGGPYGLPQPVHSGSVDVGGIKPVNSGSVSLSDAIAKARNFAAGKGITYDGRASSRNDSRRDSYRTRSPSPAHNRNNFRDNYNPYRDERRGASDRNTNRDRSLSPRRYGSPNYRERSPPRGNAAAPTGDGDSEVVPIEKGLVGLIIGRGGENLRRVESTSGARVQFVDSADAPGPHRHCRVSGSRSAVAHAKAEIFKIIEDNDLAKRGQDKARGPAGKAVTTVTQEGDSLQMMVPDRTVGLIIGRGGETIRDLQDRSGCHVNIVGENKSVNGYRPVNLIGSAASQRHAKDLILEIVESDQKGISIKELQTRREEPAGKVNDKIVVPGDAVGMIIGKGGETIRQMQDSTGCKINVSQPAGRDLEREIGLIGGRSAIEAAKRAIMDKVEAAGGRSSHRGNDSRDGRDNRHDRGHSYDEPTNPYAAGGAPTGLPPAGQAAPGESDPYAPYGGYNNYVQMWYAALQQQQQPQPGGPGQGEQR